MAKTSITVVRHGETEWNVAMRLQGMQNSPLTARGILQAKQAANALREKTFDKLISSDLERAILTAQILNGHHDLPLETEKSLRERNFGIMEGLTREEILARFPDTFRGYMNRKKTYPIPKGESLVDFYARVTGGLKRIAAANEGKRLLLVTHGGVLDCMMRMIFDYPLDAPRRFSIYNASINVFSVEEGLWQLDTWGNIDFQPGEAKSLEEPK